MASPLETSPTTSDSLKDAESSLNTFTESSRRDVEFGLESELNDKKHYIKKLSLLFSVIMAMVDVGTDISLIIQWINRNDFAFAVYQVFWLFMTNIMQIGAMTAYKPSNNNTLWILIIIGSLFGLSVPISGFLS